MAKWQEITTLDEWKAILEQSDKQPAVILKHSTTCPVSASALEEYEDYLAKKPNESVSYYLVKVIESRPVSNQIAEDLKVKHQSPQIIFIKNKEAIWNASHWSVTAKHMAAVLD
jgi:bacillithiol system protein YtxJ